MQKETNGQVLTTNNGGVKNRAAMIFAGMAANPNFRINEVLFTGELGQYLAVAIKAAKAIDKACDSKEDETELTLQTNDETPKYGRVCDGETVI